MTSFTYHNNVALVVERNLFALLKASKRFDDFNVKSNFQLVLAVLSIYHRDSCFALLFGLNQPCRVNCSDVLRVGFKDVFLGASEDEKWELLANG